MKTKLLFVPLVALLFAGCYNRDVHLDFETEHFTMTMQSEEHGLFDGWSSSYWHIPADTMFNIYNPVARMAAEIMETFPHDSLNMYVYDVNKSYMMPNYRFIALRKDTIANDPSELVVAMMDKGLLRADTTYEPVQLLVIADSAVYHAYRDTVSHLCNTFNNMTEYLRRQGLPVLPSDELQADTAYAFGYLGQIWGAHSQSEALDFIESMGMSLSSDPECRQMRVVTFNRMKGCKY